MGTHSTKITGFVFGLVAVTVTGLLPNHAIAADRPQEVLDLIAGHQALAMKIRPLQDRVLTGFKPEGAPIRAKVNTTDESGGEAPTSAPERLRHKDRAASSSDEHGRIKVRFSALEKNAKTERERVNRPQFGADLTRSKSEIADARKKLAALQREFAALEREVNSLGGQR